VDQAVLYLLALAPLAFMAFWLVRVRRGGVYGDAASG
jgi:hypothetical protein